VEVGFFSGSRDFKPSFSVYITDAQGRNLNVREYLRVHGRQDVLEQFVDQGKNTSLQAFVFSFLTILDRLFLTELKEILEGSKWEVIPFNWRGYK